MEKVINGRKIIEIALNPMYTTNDDYKSLENQGFRVRWMEENESNDKNIFQLIVDENQ